MYSIKRFKASLNPASVTVGSMNSATVGIVGNTTLDKSFILFFHKKSPANAELWIKILLKLRLKFQE
ncbi:Uncharacterised protein [Acinetobacter baumannii]|nr:Uncharacterised protein [Acinetobacter baumannii]